jgi:hypothetical protein
VLILIINWSEKNVTDAKIDSGRPILCLEKPVYPQLPLTDFVVIINNFRDLICLSAIELPMVASPARNLICRSIWIGKKNLSVATAHGRLE